MIIVTILFLFGGYIFIYTFIETSFEKKLANGKRTNKTDIQGYWVKLLMVAIFTFFRNGNQWPLLFSLFFLSFWHLLFYLKELPDYNLEILRLKILKNTLFFWSTVCLLVIKIFESFSNCNSGIIIYFLGWPLIIFIIYLRITSPLSNLLIEPSKLSTSNAFIQRIKILLYQLENFNKRHSQIILYSYVLKIEENNPHSPLKIFINNKKDEKKCFISLFEHIDSLFLMALSKFPKDVNLRIDYILFLISKMNNKKRAAQQLDICEKNSEKTLEEDFIIYRHKKQYEENGEFHPHVEKEEIGNFLLFKAKFKQFKSLITRVSVLYVEFWNLLFKNHIDNQQDFHTLNKYGSEINSLISEINTLYLKLKKIKKHDLELLELYHEFLFQILSDYKQSSELHKEIESIILNPNDSKKTEEIDNENFDINTLISDDTHFYLIFSGNPKNFCKISHVSNEICTILGYSQNELCNNSINVLIPEIFREEHDKCILEKTNNNIEQKTFLKDNPPEYKKRNEYAITKYRYLIPFNFRAFFIQTDSKESLWILKILKFSNYFSENEKKLNIPFLILTNDNFIIQNVSSNCIKLFGNNLSNLMNTYDITTSIKEFHEEFLKYSLENENLTYEERLIKKKEMIRDNYHNPTQITWIRTFHNGEEIEKRRENLLLSVQDLLFNDNIKGYIFSFESMSTYSSEENSERNDNEHPSSLNNSSKKNSKLNKKGKKKVYFQNDNNDSADFISGISKEKELLPNNFSNQLNGISDDGNYYLQEKEMEKIEESNNNDNLNNSNDDTSKISEEYTSEYSSDSNSNEENNNILKKEISISNKSENDNYYHITFTKINFQIYNFQTLRYEDTPYDKKSKVQQILDKETDETEKEEKQNNENIKLQNPIFLKEMEKEEEIKKENLFQQINDSLLKEEVPSCIIKLKIISFIIFLIIISYGIFFLFLIQDLINRLQKKYDNIKQTFELHISSVHGLKVVRELVLLSFPEYNTFYTDKENYKQNYTGRLEELYLDGNTFISELITTATLSKNNYDIIFETTLSTFFINIDYSIGKYDLTFVTIMAKIFTGLFGISKLPEEEVTPLNVNVFFYIKNNLNGVLNNIELCQDTFIDELNKVIKNRKKIFIIAYAFSSAILLSTFYLIYKIFMEVQATKNSYLEVFFDIKGNIILNYLNKCEIFSRKIQNLSENKLFINEDSEEARLNNEKIRQKIKTKNGANQESEVNSNQKKSLIITMINILFFLMQVFVVIYVLIIILIVFNFVRHFKEYIMVFSFEEKLQTNTLLLYIYVREYIFDENTYVNNLLIKDFIDNVFEKNLRLNEENQIKISKYQNRFDEDYTRFRYSIFQNDICNYTDDFFNEFYPNNKTYNCSSLLNGGLKYGLSVIISNIFEELRIMKSQKDNYKKIWKENNLTYNLTLFGTNNYTSSDNFTDENKKSLFKKYSPLTIFNSNEMKEMEIVTEYIFIPTLLKLRQNLDKSVIDYIENTKVNTYIMCLWIVIFFTFLYVFLWTNYVNSLNNVIYQTKKMLGIIPRDIFISLNSVNKLLNIKADNRRRSTDLII